MSSTLQFCTFSLDRLMFGVPLQSVQEVLCALPMTSVPLAALEIKGLMNLRGQLVTAVDLRRRLELTPFPAGQEPMNVVVRSQDGAICLLVDEIGDVVEVEESTFERPPETLQGNVRALILGIHKLDSRLLHVLDIEKACHVEILADAASP